MIDGVVGVSFVVDGAASLIDRVVVVGVVIVIMVVASSLRCFVVVDEGIV